MKYNKVYAQCVRRPKGKAFEEINEYELDGAYEEIIEDALDRGLVGNTENDDDLDRELGELWDKIDAYFKKNRILNCGDYCIRCYDDDEDYNYNRPNMCGWDTDIIL